LIIFLKKIFDKVASVPYSPPCMKSTSFITTLATALVAVGITSLAYAEKNPYTAIEGNVGLKGLGTELGIAYSDLKVSAKLTGQATGDKVVAPVAPATGVFGVNGQPEKASKLTNKEIIAAARALGVAIPEKGVKLRWAAYTDTQGKYVTIIQAYDKSGPVAVIPAEVISADVSWVNNYSGVYGGVASLTATGTASGTSVYVTDGKLSGLTEVSGKALGYLNFAGIGKFTADSKKQLGAKAKISGGDNAPAPVAGS